MDKWESDVLMKQTWVHLAEDFAVTYEGDTVFRRLINSYLEDPLFHRKYSWHKPSCLSPDYFKRLYQLETFHKRYRFANDMYTQEELEDMTLEKFLGTQSRLASPFETPPFIRRILDRARLICLEILGEFSSEELHDCCRFGKKACFNVPLRESNLHVKLSRVVTGSTEHIRWFKNYLVTDNLLRNSIASSSRTGSVEYGKCSALPLSLVPKSYKALRVVRPPTLISSFYTQGIGRMITLRLREKARLDIRHLQEKHRYLVRRSSISRKLVTADLSSASDSISRQLLEEILPPTWFQAIMLGRSNLVTYKGKTYHMNTVMTMGDGDTFPLQTLVFYSLLKAIGYLDGRAHFVSVYGDDLIYSTHLHKYVVVAFPRLHLILNEDKTYVRAPFRESCGSDCYRGVDVRPFCPEGESRHLSKSDYVRLCYKLYNGLLHRWAEEEIPLTLSFLRREIIKRSGLIFQVPPSYPDDSGVHVDFPIKHELFSPVRKSKGLYKFRCFSAVAKYKPIARKHVQCYYWDTLRVNMQGVDVVFWKAEPSFPALKYHRAFDKHRRKRWLPAVPVIGQVRRLEQESSVLIWD